MTQSYELAQAYVVALTGSLDSVIDWRALHDQDKSAAGHAKRGSLQQWWAWMCAMNNQGYGIFCNVAEMDGQGRELANVAQIRSHYIDNDGPDAQQQAERAAAAHPSPTFAVITSPGKAHTYWVVEPYKDNSRFYTIQRKLRQVFNGDRSVIDPTRVLRVPGTLHQKSDVPHLVTCHALPGYGTRTTVDALEAALVHITAVEGEGERVALGEGDQAPSLDWLRYALTLVDPSDLDRQEWFTLTCAVKQAGWTLADEPTLRALWDEWCARYAANDPAENEKMWRSVTTTELGWRTLCKRVPSLQASISFGVGQPVATVEAAPANTAVLPMPEPPALDCGGEYLTHLECEAWFKGCTFVTKVGQILAPNGTFMNASTFNVEYGGKQFIITGEGKKTDEAWKAATRSTLWTVPKVHHTRFLPRLTPGAIVKDDLGRTGVNMYIPPERAATPGDVEPFLRHMRAIVPDDGDLNILFDWMACIIKYPGFKIPWAPVIQSAEGIGKGIIKDLMTYAVGISYVHYPNAQQLGDSGGKFNGWMRNKVFILADEIKVDEKRHMVEVLKPLISEKLIEVQSKGVDQQMEDNPACWGFFTNYQDAVPVYRNGRRYAMFFSVLQTEADILAAGMDDAYFKALFNWMEAAGNAHVTHWLMQRAVSPETIPMRAPKTTSWEKAVEISRSPIERVIQEAVADGVAGFKGGWVSSIAVLTRCKEAGAIKGGIQPATLATILNNMGYTEVGRADRPWFVEDRENRATLYAFSADADVRMYGLAQGYE